MKLIRKNFVLIAMLFCAVTVKVSTASNFIEIKSENEYQQLLNENKIVLVDFSAPWCSVCKRAEPEVVQLSQNAKYKNVKFVKVEVDGNKFRDIKEKNNVAAYPTFVLFENGKETARIVGRKMAAVIEALDKAEQSPSISQPMVAAKTKPAQKKVSAVQTKPAEKPVAKHLAAPKQEFKTAEIECNYVELCSESEFNTLLKNGQPLVLDFYTTWCGPCKMMAPVFKELAEEFSCITFVKIDAERFPSIARRYQVKGYPTFVFLNSSGKQLDSMMGSGSKLMLKNKITRIQNR